MDIPTSAISTGLRVGVQIASNQKRPVVEIYHQVRNTLGPEHEIRVPVGDGTEVQKHRFSDQFITFTAINIGSLRAENLSFRVEEGFKRARGGGFGEIFETTIPHTSAGQALFLMKLDTHELEVHPPEGGPANGMQTEPLRITVSYDGPWEGLNRIGRLWAKLRKRKQFVYRYVWNPTSVFTDFPPIEYA